MNEMQQQARIQAHRATDVADDNQRARLLFGFTPGQFEDFSAVFEVSTHDATHIGIRTLTGRGLTVRWTLPQVPAHLRHQLFGLLHLFPRERLEIFFPEHLNSTVGCSLWLCIIVVVLFVDTLMRSTRSFTLAHLRSQVLALLLVCIQVLGQSFALRGWKAHLPLVAFCRSPWILTLIILTVPHIPIIEKHLVKERFLLVLCQQRAFERVIKVLFIGDIDIFQCLGKIKHLARPYIDTYLPEDAAKFSQAIEQALTALQFQRTQRVISKVMPILQRFYAHG